MEQNNNTILVIDDDKLIREAIVKYLKEDKYTVYTAKNGQEGLDVYNREKPSLILLDLIMPVMNGYEFIDKVKLTVFDPLSIIVLTGYSDSETLNELFDHGVSAFLRKPFDILELKALVKRTMSLIKLQKERLKEIEERKSAEQKIKHNYERQEVISKILKTALEPISLEEQLYRTLELLLSLTWLCIQSKGAIFTVDNKNKKLIMIAQKNLSPDLQKAVIDDYPELLEIERS
ncbi:Signal transduction response regulator, receiver region domain protein, partial [Candidatus Magnetoovum chiemensis]